MQAADDVICVSFVQAGAQHSVCTWAGVWWTLDVSANQPKSKEMHFGEDEEVVVLLLNVNTCFYTILVPCRIRLFMCKIWRRFALGSFQNLRLLP